MSVRDDQCHQEGATVACHHDLPDGGFGFVLGDVSGKGLPAALLTAVVQGVFAIEASLEMIPAHQKRIIARANQQGKLVVTATQMLITHLRGDNRIARRSELASELIVRGSTGPAPV